MKTFRCLMMATAAILLTTAVNAQSFLSSLTSANGIAAGKSLLALYTQYKTDGKFDLSNADNIANIASLITNIKGLTTKSDSTNTSASFIEGLISGSQNLVSSANSNSVLSTLGSIANLDTSSLGDKLKSTATKAATSAAASAVSGLLSKVTGKSSSTTASSSSTDNSTTSAAASVLADLFKSM